MLWIVGFRKHRHAFPCSILSGAAAETSSRSVSAEARSKKLCGPFSPNARSSGGHLHLGDQALGPAGLLRVSVQQKGHLGWSQKHSMPSLSLEALEASAGTGGNRAHPPQLTK